MNLFLEYNKKIFKVLSDLERKKEIKIPLKLRGLTVELPPKNHNADISCNAAMILSKYNSTLPEKIAEVIKVNLLSKFKEFKNIEIAKPGFLNITFHDYFWEQYVSKIIKLDNKFGSNKSSKQKYNIEFVSANPTGPLHVGHCRGAVLGDVLSNILIFNNNKVIKEYYVNDHGGQIENFVLSVYYRILEIINKKPFPDNKDLYPGDYIIDIAKIILSKKIIKNFNNYNKICKKLTKLSLQCSMKIINKNLNLLGIKHDNFIYESRIIKKNNILNVIKKLKKKNFIYEGQLKAPKGEQTRDWKLRNQLLFKSTHFGDDVDRPLQKADGSWTYFAGDIVYHSNKISRNFDILINILGADHAGYTKRIISATKALSNNKINLICKVSQMVKLYKKGEPFKMSKRKGDYITLEDLINEVGKDATRFMMLSRSNDVELDFDFQKVTEKSKDNPVFYVQYAFARINSIFRILKINIDDKIKIHNDNFILNNHEKQILRKISEWPKCVQTCAEKYEPHRIPYFLYDLVTMFHSYWNLGNENRDFRFITNNKPTSNSKLLLLKSLSIVIKNGMSLLGVSAPKTM